MNCSKCGSENILGSTFCIKCGADLRENVVKPPQQMYEQPNDNVQKNEYINLNTEQSIYNNQSIEQQNLNQTQPSYSQMQMNQTNMPSYQQASANRQEQLVNIPKTNSINVDNRPLNYLMYIVAVLLKPVKCFKEEENKFNSAKTSIVFSSIVAIGIMLINLIKTMISTVFTKSFDYTTFKMKTSVDFSNLKNLDYLDLIGKQLLIYAGIILAIALVYYLASLVVKKQFSFTKMLAISATSVIPFTILSMIVSPLLGKIWAPLSVVALVIGIVYSLLIFITLINKDITFENGDSRIYFNLICLSILGSAGYYVYMKLLMSGLGSKLNDLLDFFS